MLRSLATLTLFAAIAAAPLGCESMGMHKDKDHDGPNQMDSMQDNRSMDRDSMDHDSMDHDSMKDDMRDDGMSMKDGMKGSMHNAAPEDRKKMRGMAMMDVSKAVAVLEPTEGNDVKGTVMFQQMGKKVKVTVDVTGLKPNSTHGFHIHKFGDITKDDGTSAGGHYNPEDNEHALPPNTPRHAGDLGNIKADADGKAHKVITVSNISICGKKDPILGRGVIVHAKQDDGGQPTGNAGSRVAMGVIGVANTK